MLTIECAYADSVSCEAADASARAEAVALAIGSVRRIANIAKVDVYRYVENDAPGYGLGTPLRVLEQTPEEIDALWFTNVSLFVEETDEATFARRCGVAIRPGSHRGTIFLDDTRIELHYDACEPSALSWSLPRDLQLDPDDHAAIVEEVARDRGVSVRLGYRSA